MMLSYMKGNCNLHVHVHVFNWSMLLLHRPVPVMRQLSAKEVKVLRPLSVLSWEVCTLYMYVLGVV